MGILQLIHHILVIKVILQTNIQAAPSELNIDKIGELEEIANVKQATLDDPITSEVDQAKRQRQKRFNYNYGLDYAPINPVTYGQDPFQHIFRRLQDIAEVVRSPNYNLPPPPPSLHFPILVPVIYIPQVGCGCNPNTPENNEPLPPPKDKDRNNTDVDLSNRFPDMDDRQNWGLVVNDTELDDGLGDDFTRPISFEPIRPPNNTMSKPPPVDHGSSQAGAGTVDQLTTTTISPFPPRAPTNTAEPPSACDGAILTCCHQIEVTYDCFALQGCPDPTAYGNPCDTKVILRVIDRFQKFYGRKNG